ncbi:MAG TPA: Gfo/Idh/MocA family oxidoreductase [Jatrophihabitans sp.]|jgi:predicted dehydrogenase|uniref:Gfo/Idh/MocA family protein n=1 Tax=Jatrophihabitans sp. TaxID=1932789 RepID=UPI002F1B3308
MRVAVLGCGFGAQHLDWLSQHPEFDLDTLFYQHNRERAVELANRYGIASVSADPVGELSRRGIELAVIVTPPDTRQALVRAALDAGAFAFVDKPLSHSLESATELAALAAGAPQRCAVNFQWRSHPAVREVRDQLAVGVGVLHRVHASFYHDFFRGQQASWRQQPASAGAGTLGDQGVHLFDLLHWLIPRDWSAVAAQTSTVRQDPDGQRLEPAAGRTEDLAEVWLQEPESGCLATVSLSRLVCGVRAIEFEVQGSDRTLRLRLEADDGSAELTTHGSDGTSKTARYGPTSLDPYPPLLAVMAGKQDPDGLLASFDDGLRAQARLAEAVALAARTPPALPS